MCGVSIVAESMEPQAPVGPQPAAEGGPSSAKPMTFAEPKRDSNAALAGATVPQQPGVMHAGRALLCMRRTSRRVGEAAAACAAAITVAVTNACWCVAAALGGSAAVSTPALPPVLLLPPPP